jgi:beta-N-acetylhexosaminidase
LLAHLVLHRAAPISRQQVAFLFWPAPKGTPDISWYVHEVPTVFVSLNHTTHLHDATMVKCYINAYHSSEEIIKQVVDKIMGESEFKGTPNDLVWTDKWQATL